MIAPKAITASQRLEMQGEEVTVESIKAENEKHKHIVENESAKSTNSDNQALGCILKGLLIFTGFIFAIPILFVLFILLVVFFAVLFGTTVSLGGLIPAFLFTAENSLLLVISLLLIVGVPVFMLTYGLARLKKKSKSNARTAYIVAIVLWIAGIFMFAGTVANSKDSWWSNHSNWNVTVNGVNWNNRNARAVNTGVFIDQVREVPEFRYLVVEGYFDIQIENSPYQQVKLSACPNFLSEISTQVRGETLFLDFLQDNVRLRNAVQVRISSDMLERITVEGAGNVRNANEVFRSENFRANIEGAGNVNLNVEIENEFRVNVAGAGNVNLRGKSNSLHIDMAGAGRINTRNLKAEHVRVDVSGVGSVQVYASQSLNASADGVARVTVFGNPENVIKNSDITSRIRMR